MTDRKTLLNEIDSFCEKHGIAPSRFGRDCLGNPNFVEDLRQDKVDPKLSTITKIRKWIKNRDKQLTKKSETDHAELAL